MILFIKHIDIEGPETLGTFLVEMGHRLSVVDLHKGGSLPESLTGIDAVVSLGGPMNVYEVDKYHFLQDEDAFIKKVLAQQVPFLGICLGSQLLAKAAGGSVARSPKPEIGWFTVDLTPEGRKDPLFQGLPSVLEVYHWHGDMCVPPQGAMTLATAERCPMQAFRVGVNAYGLQFHSEITDKSIDEWSAEYAPQSQQERAGMLARYQEVKNIFHQQGRLLCQNFGHICDLSRL